MYERPKSRRATLPIQRAYWTGSGWSSPKRWRMRSISSGPTRGFWSRAASGPPGVRWTRKKLALQMANSKAADCSSRRTRKRRTEGLRSRGVGQESARSPSTIDHRPTASLRDGPGEDRVVLVKAIAPSRHDALDLLGQSAERLERVQVVRGQITVHELLCLVVKLFAPGLVELATGLLEELVQLWIRVAGHVLLPARDELRLGRQVRINAAPAPGCEVQVEVVLLLDLVAVRVEVQPLDLDIDAQLFVALLQVGGDLAPRGARGRIHHL